MTDRYTFWNHPAWLWGFALGVLLCLALGAVR